MSEMSKSARKAMKEKAQRRASPTKGDIDASGWREPVMLTGKKKGPAPVNPRAFKRGGKVEGDKARAHGGKAPRHSDVAEDKKLVRSMVKPSAIKRADGGKAEESFGWGSREKEARALLEKHGMKLGNSRNVPYVYKAGDDPENSSIDPDKLSMKRMQHVNRALDMLTGHDMKSKYVPVKTITGKNPAKKAKIYKEADYGNTMRVRKYKSGKYVGKDAYSDADNPGASSAEGVANDYVNKKRGGGVSRRARIMKRLGKDDGGPVSNAAAKVDFDRKAAESARRSNTAEAVQKGISRMGRDPFEENDSNVTPRKRGGKVHSKSCSCKECSGGRVMRKTGGSVKGNYGGGTRPTGGRTARAYGGSLMLPGEKHKAPSKGKGDTNIRIVIGKTDGQPGTSGPIAAPTGLIPPPPPARPPMAPPGGGAMSGPPGMPPGLGGPPPGLGGAGPGSMPPGLMGRKAGGRVYKSYKDMDAGAAGGEGRIEKTEIQKRKRVRGG